MKVLFDCHLPFLLAHGGMQTQIEQSQAALGRLGVTVEPLRWWDEHQTGGVIHHFGRMPTLLVRLAQEKGMTVVMSPFMSALGARPAWKRRLQKAVMRGVQMTAPRNLIESLAWDSFRLADACVAMTEWEAFLMSDMFRAPPDRVHVIPNGVEEIFLTAPTAPRGKWLVCTTTIIELKQVLKLAQIAVLARTPLWVIGRPYSQTDAYGQAFMDYAKENREWVRYDGPVADRERLAGIYREARGFVLLSKWESLSLSALEAAACGCPLLLSDLPWARWAFKDTASYVPAGGTTTSCAPILREFYERAPELPTPPKPLSWTEVATRLKRLYERLVTTSR